MNGLSLRRLFAILMKEFIQMRRDRMTFALMIGVPVMQLLLFGFAINTDPRHLPTVVHIADDSAYARSIGAALKNSEYFDIVATARTPQEAERMLDEGEVAFAITVPVNFARDLVRGESPQLLIQADASDPAASSIALATISELAESALKDDLIGPIASRANKPAFTTVIHRRYNPEGITQYNIVPGLIAVILTMTMVMVTAMAMTREREKGTFENLLAMPASPFEVMIGKITPYVVVGYIQATLIIIGARFVFDVPMIGSLALLAGTAGLFIAANLALGFTFSTIAKNQLQAMQMTVFFLLPSILLSGFMFPFAGMPGWAQLLGTIVPATHFLRIIRAVMLKGGDIVDVASECGTLLIILVVISGIAMLRYRQTLD